MMRVRRVIANVDCTFDTSDDPEFPMNTKREVRERNAAALLDLCRKHRGGVQTLRLGATARTVGSHSLISRIKH